MADFSPQDKKRITFLSIFATLDGDYDATHAAVQQLEEDGYLSGKSEAPSRGRSERSGRRDSGSGRRSGGGGSQKMRDPGGPPTEKQVATVLKNTDDYTEDEIWDMSKEDVSNIIEDLFNN